jgi:hypothetical protein
MIQQQTIQHIRTIISIRVLRLMTTCSLHRVPFCSAAVSPIGPPVHFQHRSAAPELQQTGSEPTAQEPSTNKFPILAELANSLKIGCREQKLALARPTGTAGFPAGTGIAGFPAGPSLARVNAVPKT